MPSRLIPAWLRLTLLWWGVALVCWALSDVRIAQTLTRLTGEMVVTNAFTAWHDTLRVLWLWSARVMAVMGGCWLAGGALAALALRGTRHRPPATTDAWQGVSINRGTLERPAWANLEGMTAPCPVHDLTTEWPAAAASHLDIMTPAQHALARRLTTLIHHYPGAYTGPGHGVRLREHSLNLLKRLPPPDDKVPEPLLPLMVLAHDIGKLISFRRDTAGQWQRVAWHDDCGARILTALAEFHALPLDERQALRLATGYSHKRSSTPRTPDRAVNDRVHHLQQAVRRLDSTATQREKRDVVARRREQGKLDQTLYKALEKTLGQLVWVDSKRRKNPDAAGFAAGDYLYVAERALADAVRDALKTLDEDLWAAWDETRQARQFHPMTGALIETMDRRDWLIHQCTGAPALDWVADDGTMRADPPLWLVQSGKVAWKGMLILPRDPHPEPGCLVRASDVAYTVQVLSPMTGTDGEPLHNDELNTRKKQALAHAAVQRQKTPKTREQEKREAKDEAKKSKRNQHARRQRQYEQDTPDPP